MKSSEFDYTSRFAGLIYLLGLEILTLYQHTQRKYLILYHSLLNHLTGMFELVTLLLWSIFSYESPRFLFPFVVLSKIDRL